jgi:AAA15 family ATPase/GTPase
MGDLVLIVGPNNSGKSNVLDALLALGSKDGIKNSDITITIIIIFIQNLNWLSVIESLKLVIPNL